MGRAGRVLDLLGAFQDVFVVMALKKTREVCSSHYMMLLSSRRLAAATVTFLLVKNSFIP